MNIALDSSSVENSSFLRQSLSDGIKDFKNLDLRGVVIQKTVIVDANFNGANLTGANFNAVKLLRRVSFKNSILDRSSFIRGLVRECNFEGASLQEADFQYSTLSGSILNSANLTGANFSHAKLTNTNFEGANLTGTGLGAHETKILSPEEAISPDFIQQCQSILTELIGPIAKLLVQQAVQSSSNKDKTFFVNQIKRQITDEKMSNIFDQKIEDILQN